MLLMANIICNGILGLCITIEDTLGSIFILYGICIGEMLSDESGTMLSIEGHRHVFRDECAAKGLNGQIRGRHGLGLHPERGTPYHVRLNRHSLRSTLCETLFTKHSLRRTPYHALFLYQELACTGHSLSYSCYQQIGTSAGIREHRLRYKR